MKDESIEEPLKNGAQADSAALFSAACDRARPVALSGTNRGVIALIIATDYEIRPDPDGLLRIYNRRAPLCPDCGDLCSGYDSRIRKLIRTDGSAQIFKLRRLRCPTCRKLHVEIPDLMEPRKHYERAAIEEARAGSDEVAAEDSTLRRWRK